LVFESEAMIYIDEIFRAAVRMTMKKEDAEDLVQETFMQAWKSFERYEPGTNQSLVNPYFRTKILDVYYFYNRDAGCKAEAPVPKSYMHQLSMLLG